MGRDRRCALYEGEPRHTLGTDTHEMYLEPLPQGFSRQPALRFQRTSSLTNPKPLDWFSVMGETVYESHVLSQPSLYISNWLSHSCPPPPRGPPETRRPDPPAGYIKATKARQSPRSLHDCSSRALHRLTSKLSDVCVLIYFFGPLQLAPISNSPCIGRMQGRMQGRLQRMHAQHGVLLCTALRARMGCCGARHYVHALAMGCCGCRGVLWRWALLRRGVL